MPLRAAQKFFSVLEITFCFLILIFAGCESTTSTSGRSKKNADSPPKKTQTSAPSDDPLEEGEKNPSSRRNPKIKPPTNDDPKQVSPSEPKLPSSKLNWDGKRLIGTDQLFLVPIE